MMHNVSDSFELQNVKCNFYVWIVRKFLFMYIHLYIPQFCMFNYHLLIPLTVWPFEVAAFVQTAYIVSDMSRFMPCNA